MALAEYAPYSFLKGGIFINESTNDSSRFSLTANFLSAFDSSSLSSIEYRSWYKFPSLSEVRNASSIPAF